jgi:regulator of protease activity HflC (stomatin/prohibitin superfamily)
MSQERTYKTLPGMLMLLVNIAVWSIAIWRTIDVAKLPEGEATGGMIGFLFFLYFLATMIMLGFFIVEPNWGKVLLLFGKYKGTVKVDGFHWANPFFTKRKVSLRANTLNTETLKVNDSGGNPIEIAAVVVWRVEDTYDASFEVEEYYHFVATQSEAAIRRSASQYPYDGDDETISLRKNTQEVSEHLQEELGERLSLAGIHVIEARLSHLAYAPEIAGAMLRRQQAGAIIEARQLIVDGAVGMVEMALSRMEKEGVITLDEERKAAMISNLMVVLCSESAAQPVLNTGHIYG